VLAPLLALQQQEGERERGREDVKAGCEGVLYSVYLLYWYKSTNTDT
jgi:hypothetical protein